MTADRQPDDDEPLRLPAHGDSAASSHGAAGARERARGATRRSSRARQRVEDGGWFAYAYAFAAGIGLIPVFISPGLWFIPIAAMGAYIGVGYGRARDGAVVFEFADSVYYLGFTLSVGSLLASLEPFNFVKRPDPEHIFHYFGLGMLTTLLGVLGRTVLQTYHRAPDERLEVVNQQISVQAHRYLDQLSALNARVEATLTATTRLYDDDISPKLARVGAVIQSTVEELERTAAASRGIVERATKTSSAIEALGTAYEHATGGLIGQQGELAKANEGLATALLRTADVADERRDDLASSLVRIRNETDACRVALEALSTQVRNATIDPSGLQSGFNDAGETIRSAATTAMASVSELRDAVHAYRQTASSTEETAKAMRSAGIAEALTTLQAELSRLTTTTAEHRTLSESELSALRQQVASTLASARAMNQVLEEIAEATTKRLAQIA